MSTRQTNDPHDYLTRPPARLFLKTAIPMMLLMAMSGVQNVIDTAFLGLFTGTGAVAAVSAVFPAIMLTVATATMIGSGLSSLLARALGAGDTGRAEAILASAHGLALMLAVGSIALYLLAGPAGIALAVGDDPGIAAMARAYLGIMVAATPAQYLLAVHADAVRNEGHAALMALLSAGVTLANIALNWLLIVRLDLGAAGAAWGTALAQLAGLALLAGLRARGRFDVPLAALARHGWRRGWGAILSLGAPVSLGFVGIALVSACVIAAIRMTVGADPAQTIAAYGVVTRLLGFAFMPMMALALTVQSLGGRNHGAGLPDRSEAMLRLGLWSALAVSAGLQALFQLAAPGLARMFVTEPGVIAQAAHILRRMTLCYAATGPVLVLALYFQAIGQPARAAVLTLVKPYLLAPALILGLAALWGSDAIWTAQPVADLIVAVLAAALFLRAGRPMAEGPA